ncbi:MAG: helicase C-terminal domain-containing protein [Methanobacteriota archaeon]
MPTAMFCPLCKSLLTPYGRGKGQTRVCKACGYSEGAKGRGAPPAPPNPKHAAFPLFPYERIRDGQCEFMEDMRAAAGEGKVMVAQAPTGIGKTVATLAVLLEYCLEKKKKLLFLTSKQSQHTMVVNTLREISEASGKRIRAVDIIAKQAMCPESESSLPGYAFAAFCFMRIKSKSCPFYEADGEAAGKLILQKIMHVGELKRSCMRLGVCPYKAALDAIPDVDVVVCDYNYMFDVMRDKMLDKVEGGLQGMVLVIDEAHNLPDRIRSNLSRELNHYGMAEAAREVGTGAQRGQRYTGSLKRALNGWAKGSMDEPEEYVQKERLTGALDSALSETLGERDAPEDYIKWLVDVGTKTMLSGTGVSHALELAEFLKSWMESGEASARILARGEGGAWGLKLYHMDPATMGAPVFAEIHSAVLMSGTLCPPEMYADILAIPEGRRMLRVYGSPFPPENRRVLALKGVSSEWTRRGEAMFAKYAQTLAELAKATNGNVAVFFPSYKYVEEVSSRMAGKAEPQNLLVESRWMTKGDRDDILGRLRARDGPKLLMAVQGGSLGEGIDYEKNLLSVLVVAGMPLAPPNKEVLALRAHCVKRFGREKGEIYGYYGPAFNKVVQSAGRLIRSETDRGVVILMDERFAQQRYAAFLPPEFRPKVFDRPMQMVDEVREFFG